MADRLPRRRRLPLGERLQPAVHRDAPVLPRPRFERPRRPILSFFCSILNLKPIFANFKSNFILLQRENKIFGFYNYLSRVIGTGSAEMDIREMYPRRTGDD